MFHSDEFEIDDLFKHNDHWDHWNVPRRNVVMDIVIGLACVVGVAIILALVCRCCRSTKYRGRVLQPAPEPNTSAAAPGAHYPQQQYSTVTEIRTAVPTVSARALSVAVHARTTPEARVLLLDEGTQNVPKSFSLTAIPANHGIAVGPPYPMGGSQYPGGGPQYPASGAPYPGGAGPYPGGAPYPAAGAPYPAVSPYPAAAHGSVAPSAPDAHALPPSYDQVMSTEAKHPPYNPYAPH